MQLHGRPLCALGLALALAAFPACALASEPGVSEAQCYQIVDQDGEVLASLNPDREMDPASITKIMTAVVALDSGKSLDDVCTVRGIEYQSAAQLAGFVDGDTPSFRELLQAMLIYSGNDAADNVALSVCGSVEEFVGRMNEKAADLGLEHTRFANTHGLMAEGHHASAADLVKLGRYALENYPFIAEAVRMPSVTVVAGGKEVTLESTDDLIKTYEGLCGIKTGSVESGTTFLGASRRHGISLYSCVLGCETYDGRFDDTAALMDWAYNEHYQQMSMCRRSWPIRVETWALGFSRKLIVTSESDSGGYVEPGREIAYSTTLCDAGLVDLDAACGYSSWSQGTRQVACATYRSRSQLYDVPAVNIFALPLFFDVGQLAS